MRAARVSKMMRLRKRKALTEISNSKIYSPNTKTRGFRNNL
jgi:hypothetical protein